MTRYTAVKVNISEGQKSKIKKALENEESVNIKLDNEDYKGEDTIYVTNTQLKKMKNAQSKNIGIILKFSKTQLKENMKIKGGFFPLLLGMAEAALPTIAKALGVGALSGLASSATQKIVGNGLYLKRNGEVCNLQTDGEGLYLSPVSSFPEVGDGVYLKQENKPLYNGTGVLLGPNSPFRNIPLLNFIL